MLENNARHVTISNGYYKHIGQFSKILIKPGNAMDSFIFRLIEIGSVINLSVAVLGIFGTRMARANEGAWGVGNEGSQALILWNIKVLRGARELMSPVRNAAWSINAFREFRGYALENLSLPINQSRRGNFQNTGERILIKKSAYKIECKQFKNIFWTSRLRSIFT